MQIVIDISKERFKDIQRIASVQLDSNHFKTAEQIIANGTPQPKIGRWIEIAQYSDGKHKIECSECKSHIFDRGHANSFNVNNKYKYCPNCGAKMEVEE